MAESKASEAEDFPHRLRRRSLLALLIMLPVALALRGHETALAWWRGSDLFEQRVRPGEAATLAGAEWRVGSLQQVAERRDGSAVMLLELDAVVREPARFAELPCRIVLTDQTGRRWLPSFLTPSEVNRMPGRRGAATTSCNSAIATKPGEGASFRITESFVLPRDAAGEADVVVSLPGGRPRYLRFQRKG